MNTIPACYHIFQSKQKVVLLYNELSKLFKNTDIVTIDVCLDKNILYSCYRGNQLIIVIQLLIGHYCQFLVKIKLWEILEAVVVNDSVTREAITRKQERAFLELVEQDSIFVSIMGEFTFYLKQDFVFLNLLD